MNLILHQLRTDVRHFRWRLAVLWFSFVVEAVLAGTHWMPAAGTGITIFLLDLWQAIFALALVASLIQTDALVGASAAWLTRPMRRQHLFWAKTLFIVLCLLGPRLVMQVLGWAARGYSMHLEVAAVKELLLFSLACVLVVAALAALTRDLGRFFLAVGITMCGIFAAAATVGMLVHAGVLHQARIGWPEELQRATSALVVAWLMLSAAALAAWVSQARLGSWWTAVGCLAAGFIAFPLITTVWSKNFLAPRLKPSAPLTVMLLATNHPFLTDLQNQLLSPELAVTDVPDRQVAVVQNLSVNILFKGDKKATWLRQSPNPQYPNRIRPAESAQQNNYLDQIAAYFPADTIWFKSDANQGIGSTINNYGALNRFPKGAPPGKLDGRLTVDLFEVRKVGETPLRPATFPAIPGLRVTIQEVWLTEGVIHVALDECGTQLMLDREMDMARQGYNNGAFCSYVLYHASSGEAFLVSHRNTWSYFPALLSGESHLAMHLEFPYPALRERLAGVTAEDWMREARLCVFAPVYAGTSQLTFNEDHYVLQKHDDESLRRQKEKSDDAQTIAAAALPPNASRADLDAYLSTILLNIPDNWDQALHQTVENKLLLIGTEGLPALLRHLPVAPRIEDNFVFPAISKLITRDELPDLRAALQRDNRVVRFFEEKHWEADARDLLVAKLPDHRERMNADALRLAAEAKNPATYPDLRWHFVHLDSGHEEVVGALEQCPGFDTVGAVRDAWQGTRLGIAGAHDLAAVAAKYGLPDALNLAVIHAESANDSSTRRSELAQLANLTGYTGPTNETLAWLTENLTRFHFDPARQRYMLQTAQ